MIKHEYHLESSDSITLKYKSHGPNIKYERYEKDRSPPIAPEIFLRLGMEKRIKYKYYRGPSLVIFFLNVILGPKFNIGHEKDDVLNFIQFLISNFILGTETMIHYECHPDFT